MRGRAIVFVDDRGYTYRSWTVYKNIRSQKLERQRVVRCDLHALWGKRCRASIVVSRQNRRYTIVDVPTPHNHLPFWHHAFLDPSCVGQSCRLDVDHLVSISDTSAAVWCRPLACRSSYRLWMIDPNDNPQYKKRQMVVLDEDDNVFRAHHVELHFKFYTFFCKHKSCRARIKVRQLFGRYYVYNMSETHDHSMPIRRRRRQHSKRELIPCQTFPLITGRTFESI